ncbi:MAG: hypothetical protein JXQ29_11240 [Planctomycetes bacterium]|nr:hypothetical protein [Planctomycetota bacterium]
MIALIRSTPVALALALLVGTGAGQLNGTYTIDPSGSGSRNFKTFNAAVTALAAGVNGPVTFTIASVVFQETVLIATPISGASATNTISFVAPSGQAVLDANGQNDALRIVSPVSWLRFENIKIINWRRRGLVIASGAGLPRDFVFSRIEIDNEAPGSPFDPPAAFDATDVIDCVVRNCILRGTSGAAVVNYGSNVLFDSCEMDGLGKARPVLYLVNGRDSDHVVKNCFIHSPGNTRSYGYALRLAANSLGAMIVNNTIISDHSEATVFLTSPPDPWSQASSFKNNIVINLGTGPAIVFEWISNQISPYVSDHNCYYSRNPSNRILVSTWWNPLIVFSGDLAAFRAWQKQNPAAIVPGGVTSYDANSIEADPGLVSMTQPFDIHLKQTSPVIDLGTTNLVEPFQTFPQGFKVTHDFEGQVREWKPDIGADEIAASLVGSGSTSIGGTQNLALAAPRDAGLLCQVGSSFGTGPIMIGWRPLGLGLDDLLLATANNYWPRVFSGYRGVLDGQGQAKAGINIPYAPTLIGLRLNTAFVTISPSAPFGIQSISNTVSFTITT